MLHDLAITVLAAFGIVVVLSFFRPFLLAGLFRIFKRQVAATESALMDGGEDRVCNFSSFSNAAQKGFEALRADLLTRGFRPLVDYENAKLRACGGGESYSSVYASADGETIACLSYIRLGKAFRLADFIGSPCNDQISATNVTLSFESSKTSGNRLFTVRSETAMPEMPVRYSVKTLQSDTSLERVLEVHSKRLAAWRGENGGDMIVYSSAEIALEEQAKQRAELTRFDAHKD